MRISSDSDSWRAGGVIRRDTRAARDEIPDQRHRGVRDRRNPNWCGGRPNRPHRAERYAVTRWIHTKGNGDQVEIVTWGVRCVRCRTRDLPVEVVLPFAAYASIEQLQPVLAAHWCREGHLFDEPTGVTRWVYRRHGHSRQEPVHACVMCGLCKGSRRKVLPVGDARLYVSAGLDVVLAAAVTSGTSQNRERTQTARVVTP